MLENQIEKKFSDLNQDFANSKGRSSERGVRDLLADQKKELSCFVDLLVEEDTIVE